MNLVFPNPILLYSCVEASLAREIAAGRWIAGECLPGENGLIAHFRVSRSTVRRATQNLERRGLVQVIPGRGTFVT
ncbi:GntR family transcriptional regulator [Achromobacter kerstersii]|uniref:GntR family transcriptional regulator n=1 Tax=Achromobacter kerstersii TaxID=1353890 RepID=UPI0015825DBA|nr:GntR family transcriptional regulator [Achromobacter kerstersii]